MRYELMRPHQVRRAAAEHWPVVLPLGVLEYHGEHLPLGMDALAVTRALDLLERETERLVILPAFPYGAASFAVAGPETGTVQVDASALLPFAEALFFSLLRVGFRNIHAIVHHQTENFTQGMPTDLAFRLGARQAIFRFVEGARGEGWWGRPEMAAYYDRPSREGDPFGWIQVHPLMGTAVMRDYPFDHAGQGETSLMLSLAPESVDMARLGENAGWYAQSAASASPDLGDRGRDLILERLRTLLLG